MGPLIEIEIDLIGYSVDLGISAPMLLDPEGINVSGKNMPVLKPEDFDNPDKILAWYAELPQPITDDNGLELIIAAPTLTDAQWVPQSFEVAEPLAKSLTNAYLKLSEIDDSNSDDLFETVDHLRHAMALIMLHYTQIQGNPEHITIRRSAPSPAF